MTPLEIIAYNRAIDDAAAQYQNGIGAIRALKINCVKVYDHVVQEEETGKGIGVAGSGGV